MTTAPFGVIADVDGTISNLDAKRITNPTVIPSLVTLFHAGIPVVLNTGRAASFVLEHMLTPLLDEFGTDHGAFHCIFEKGAVTLSIVEGNHDKWIDPDIAVPADLSNAIRELVETEFADTTFFDPAKETMISTERRYDTSDSDYILAQKRFVPRALEIAHSLGYALTSVDAPVAGAAYRIDPNSIATDIESVRTGKDLGAMRAVELLQAHGTEVPNIWHTIGDSPADVAMADWLHENGYTVTHVDVGNNDISQKDYAIVRPDGLYDDATATYLQQLTLAI